MDDMKARKGARSEQIVERGVKFAPSSSMQVVEASPSEFAAEALPPQSLEMQGALDRPVAFRKEWGAHTGDGNTPGRKREAKEALGKCLQDFIGRDCGQY